MNLKNDLILVLTLSFFLCVFASFSSYASFSDYLRIESECRNEFPNINNSILMEYADLASFAAKKDMNILYQKILKMLESRTTPHVTKSF